MSFLRQVIIPLIFLLLPQVLAGQSREKAGNDASGLQAFYESHKDKYRWGERWTRRP